MTTNQLDTQVKRHPLRGGFYGLLAGIGAALYLVLFAVTPFSVVTAAIVVAAGVLIGILWGSFAPAKKPGSMPQARTSLGSTFTRSGSAEDTANESYETTFGSTPPAPAAQDESAFGHDPPPGHAED